MTFLMYNWGHCMLVHDFDLTLDLAVLHQYDFDLTFDFAIFWERDFYLTLNLAIFRET